MMKNTQLPHCIILLLILCLAGCTNGFSASPVPTYEHVIAIQPPNGSVASLGDDERWIMASGVSGEVCIEFEILPLLRPGDFINYWSRIDLAINGRGVSIAPTHLVFEELVGLVDESVIVATMVANDGSVIEYPLSIAEGPYSDTVCWNLGLGPGSYRALVTFVTSQDETFEYEWSFRVTN